MDGKILDRVRHDIPSLIWFSQVIGPGRGLETLVDSLTHVATQFEIHLRGNCDPRYADRLLSRAPDAWRELIHFHPQVPHQEILSRLAEHDVAYAGEVPYCRSRDLTVANKILHYLLAGIPVIASDTAGHREIAASAGSAVSLFSAGVATSLAQQLESRISNADFLRGAGKDALDAALESLCWERSAPVLLDQVTRYLEA
jgi:hypothetical protein